MNTTNYLLHPRAPLIFGTGKPLDFGLGGETLSFPFPSTVAGALKAAHSAHQGIPPNPYADIPGLNIQQLSLARFNWTKPEVPPTLLVPRPADAIYLNKKMLHLAPEPRPVDGWIDLSPGLQVLTLQGGTSDKKGKPDPAPAWWSAADLSQWLSNPASLINKPINNKQDTIADERTHVVINPLGKGARSGGLFRSMGRDFGPHHQASGTNSDEDGAYGYALAVRTQGPQNLHGSIRRLGGEGRFVRFEACHPQSEWEDVKPPKGLDKATLIRFILTSPAVFPAKGWHPDALSYDPVSQSIRGSLDINGQAISVQLIAAAITRAQSFSGWELSHDGRSGPGRPWRVVPAGSVYWLQIQAGDAPAFWGQSICTNTEDTPWKDNGWGRGFVGLA